MCTADLHWAPSTNTQPAFRLPYLPGDRQQQLWAQVLTCDWLVAPGTMPSPCHNTPFHPSQLLGCQTADPKQADCLFKPANFSSSAPVILIPAVPANGPSSRAGRMRLLTVWYYWVRVGCCSGAGGWSAGRARSGKGRFGLSISVGGGGSIAGVAAGHTMSLWGEGQRAPHLSALGPNPAAPHMGLWVQGSSAAGGNFSPAGHKAGTVHRPMQEQAAGMGL